MSEAPGRDPRPPGSASARFGRLAREALRHLGRAIVVAVHGLILTWALHPSRFWVQGLVLPLAFVLGPWIRRRAGGIAPLRVLGIGALWAFVLSFWWGFAHFADPWGSSVILAVIPVAACLAARPRALALALLPFLAWIAWQLRFAPSGFASRFAVLLAPLALDALWSRPGILERLGPNLVASFVIVLATGGAGARMYFAPDRTDVGSIAAQPGVRVLARAGDGELTRSSQIYSVVPECDGPIAIVTVHKAVHGLVLLDRRTGSVAPFWPVRRPADGPLVACDVNRMWIADTRAASLVELDAGLFAGAAPLRTIDGFPAGPGRLELSRERDRIWHMDSSRNTIRVLDLGSGQLVAEDRSFSSGVLPLEGHRIVAVHDGVLSERVLRDDGPGARPSCDGCRAHVETLWSVRLAGDFHPAIALLPNLASHDVVGDANRAFVLSTHQGWLHAVDLGARREVGRVAVPVGGRFLAYAARRDVVVASGWTRGSVDFFRGRDLARLRSVRVGSRPRIVSLTPDEAHVLVGSGAGVVEIAMPAADAVAPGEERDRRLGG